MPELSPEEQLNIARGHLERVQVAWYDPVDWADLSNYGLYALEVGVMAAARETGLAVKATHWAKAAAAGELAEAHDLDDVSDLMARLNEARKAANYGDIEMTDGTACEKRLDSLIEAWPTSETRRRATQVIAGLCESDSVIAVVVFGSAVRKAVCSFDLDVLYVYAGSKPEVPGPTFEIDLRGYSAPSVEPLIAEGHDLLCWSVRYGRCVCEKRGYWSELTTRWIDRVPLPSADKARHRADKARSLYKDTLAIGDVDAALEQYVTYLTHEARARLVDAGVFPASRPELLAQLESAGASLLARELRGALHRRNVRAHGGDKRTHQYLLAVLARLSAPASAA
ncbi:MAG: hypothetical protein IIB36_07800 [Gemmatimonadetes bacterium]|nr:hypothetical protein [Gemmatimonadota bacterium]